MRVGDKAFYDLLAMFEKIAKQKFYGRLDREDKELWNQGIIYQDGRINELFVAFRLGYALAQSEQE
jgi:uncharacterized membrane protein